MSVAYIPIIIPTQHPNSWMGIAGMVIGNLIALGLIWSYIKWEEWKDRNK